MIVWQRQPTANTCGQTCVAMLLRVDARIVIASMGDKPTYPKQLSSTLRAHGYEAPDKLVRCSKLGELPDVAICRILWPARPRFGHWILLVGTAMYDPSEEDADAWWMNGGVMTSCLPVRVPWL